MKLVTSVVLACALFSSTTSQECGNANPCVQFGGNLMQFGH